MRRKIIYIIILLLALSSIIYYVYNISPKKTIYIHILENKGGTTYPKAGIYKANKTVTIKAVPDKCFIFNHFLVNNTIKLNNTVIKLSIKGNTTIKPFFKRKPTIIKIRIYNAPYALLKINFKIEKKGNTTIKYYSPVSIYALNYTLEGYSYNTSRIVKNYECGEYTYKVSYSKEKVTIYQLKIVSNYKTKIRINGVEAETPYVYKRNRFYNARIEIPEKIALDENYSMWLAWYIIGKKLYIININATNKININVKNNETISLHYVKGLREIPYLYRIIPPEKFIENAWSTPYKILNHTIVFYPIKGENNVTVSGSIQHLFIFNGEISNIWIETWGLYPNKTYAPIMLNIVYGKYGKISFNNWYEIYSYQDPEKMYLGPYKLKITGKNYETHADILVGKPIKARQAKGSLGVKINIPKNLKGYTILYLDIASEESILSMEVGREEIPTIIYLRIIAVSP